MCLANFYDPDFDPETKAGVREVFVRALRQYPLWAVLRAFDTWDRTNTRRPAPAEIALLAAREIAPMVSEINRRKLAEAAAEDERQRMERERPTRERAEQILASVGFTPKRMAAVRSAPMAASIDEAVARQDGIAASQHAASVRAALDADPAVQRARGEP